MIATVSRMTSMYPISVIMPSFNHRRYLPDRMRSILNQTRQDFELILLDDASVDGSGDFLRAFADRPHTRLIQNSRNSGSPFVQWNRGIQEARGELIWIAESDDVADPEFLKVLSSVLEHNQTVGLAFCRSTRIDEGGHSLMESTAGASDDRWTHDFQMNGPAAVANLLYLNNTIVSASAVVFRRKIYEEVGQADAGLKLTGDWLQWSKMLLISDVHYVARALSQTRIHRVTRRQDTANCGTLELESLIVQSRIRDRLSIERELVQQGAERVAVSWLQAMRAGRFSGSILRHPSFCRKLLQTDLRMGIAFATRWPYAFAVWVVKRIYISLCSSES
ncbi:MAG: glycosyltransferase family 2 protein [Planctomycetaceae bacterium]